MSGRQDSRTFGRENENSMELSFSRPKVPGSWCLEAKIQELAAVRMKILFLTAESFWKLVSGPQDSGTFGRENENSMELSFSRPEVPGSWCLEPRFRNFRPRE